MNIGWVVNNSFKNDFEQTTSLEKLCSLVCTTVPLTSQKTTLNSWLDYTRKRSSWRLCGKTLFKFYYGKSVLKCQIFYTLEKKLRRLLEKAKVKATFGVFTFLIGFSSGWWSYSSSNLVFFLSHDLNFRFRENFNDRGLSCAYYLASLLSVNCFRGSGCTIFFNISSLMLLLR